MSRSRWIRPSWRSRASKGKVTRRERLLGEMNAVIPWESLIGLIEPHCPKVGKGRQPLGLEGILRIYFLQQWFDLSDPAAEDALYASESMRRFAGITLAEDKVPDESTILRFRHLLGKNDLTEAIFGAVRSLLEEQHILVKSATIVDATISLVPEATRSPTAVSAAGAELPWATDLRSTRSSRR